MLKRPSSRLLVIDSSKRLLLFRFQHKDGVLAGRSFWATPGGGVDGGETFEQAALRELCEEVGITLDHPGPQVAQRTARFISPTGEMVEADERYYLIQVASTTVSNMGQTALERSVITEHRWWTQADIQCATEQI